ncbi:hypothetical protein HPB47_020866, partial [Ixodes persulcatus]
MDVKDPRLAVVEHRQNEDRLHHCQTGFRSDLSFQDSFLMLHHDVLADPSSIQPKTIVAVDVQKTFGSVPHSWVIESAKLIGIHGRTVGEQEHKLQCSLEAVQSFLEDVGMTATPKKTEYVVVLSGPQHLAEEVRSPYNLTLNNTTIRRERTVCILGLFIDEDGRSGTGLSEKETRQLVQALFSSKVLYGYNYYYLTQRQGDTVENLNKEAKRIITGLPKHTWLPDLYAHGNLNKLEDYQGRPGHSPRDRAPSIVRTETSAAATTTMGKARPLRADAPLPRRMDVDHPGRRAYHVKPHERHVAVWTHDDTSFTTRTLLAAPFLPREHHQHRLSAPHRSGHFGRRVRIEAIVQAVQHAEHNHSEISTTNITVYTDSQVAYSECRHASKSTSDRVHKIYGIESRLHTNHHAQLRVAWVSAHSANPFAPIVPSIYSGPHFNSSQPDHTQPDLTERAALAKLERKKILRNLRTTAPRKAHTLVRRTATNTLMLPALRNRIFQDDPHQGYCTACNTLATTQHALADIPVADQPNTFEDWVIPRDKPPPTLQLLWNQHCSFYADGGPAGL